MGNRDSTDAALAAFRRLLADAGKGEEARLDAIQAFLRRTVFAPRKDTHAIAAYHTLSGPRGEPGFAVFSNPSFAKLRQEMLAWKKKNGADPEFEEIGGRFAARWAIDNQQRFVVVDSGSAHELLVTVEELAPLLDATSRRDSSLISLVASRPTHVGPAVRMPVARKPTQTGFDPGGTFRPVAPPPTQTKKPSEVPSFARQQGRNVRSPESWASAKVAWEKVTPELRPSRQIPSVGLIDGWRDLLRAYPEVQWACLLEGSRDEASYRPMVCLRIDPQFRKRTREIVAKLTAMGLSEFESLEVSVLEDAAAMNSARAHGTVFFPWT